MPGSVLCRCRNTCGDWGLGKEVKAAITERDYHLFRMMNSLKAELPQLQKEEILSRLEAILNELK